MDSKQMRTLVGLFFIGFLVFSLINYFILSATVEWPEQELADTLEFVDVEGAGDDLHLTWDISGQQGPPAEVSAVEQERRRMQAELDRQRSEARAMVDSAIYQETAPLQRELQESRQQVEQTQATITELERLVAMLSTRADSIDQEHAESLSKMIESMKPVEAAAVLNRLNSRVNAELLLAMRQRTAAKILAALPDERAAEVARYLSRAYARSSML